MEIFELVENTDEQVVVKVNVDSPLEVAKHPYVSMNYAYITVTKGEDHIITIIYEDGKTFSYEWGLHGFTCVANDLWRLQRKVVDFICNKNCIKLE